MPRGPVQQSERARVRELHAAGLGRNEIAKELGRGVATVSRIAEELGLSFDRSETAAATQARQVDMKARRAALADALIGDAENLRQRLYEPAEQIVVTGEGWDIATLKRPTPRDSRDLMAAVGGAVKGHMDLVKHDADAGTGEARSMLDALSAGLQAAAEELKNEPRSGHESTEPQADP